MSMIRAMPESKYEDPNLRKGGISRLAVTGEWSCPRKDESPSLMADNTIATRLFALKLTSKAGSLSTRTRVAPELNLQAELQLVTPKQ